jgi:hypothetical protein
MCGYWGSVYITLDGLIVCGPDAGSRDTLSVINWDTLGSTIKDGILKSIRDRQQPSDSCLSCRYWINGQSQTESNNKLGIYNDLPIKISVIRNQPFTKIHDLLIDIGPPWQCLPLDSYRRGIASTKKIGLDIHQITLGQGHDPLYSPIFLDVIKVFKEYYPYVPIRLNTIGSREIDFPLTGIDSITCQESGEYIRLLVAARNGQKPLIIYKHIISNEDDDAILTLQARAKYYGVDELRLIVGRNAERWCVESLESFLTTNRIFWKTSIAAYSSNAA